MTEPVIDGQYHELDPSEFENYSGSDDVRVISRMFRKYFQQDHPGYDVACKRNRTTGQIKYKVFALEDPPEGEEHGTLPAGEGEGGGPGSSDADTQVPPEKRRVGPPPSLDELKAAAEEGGETGTARSQPGEDRPPRRTPRRRKSRPAASRTAAGRSRPTSADEPVPSMPRQGRIAKGVNKWYRSGGKFIRVLDEELGEAMIHVSTSHADEGDPDDSVGAAWEAVCAVNPRVRAVVLKALSGGAYGQLAAAHWPIMLAIGLKFVSSNPGMMGKFLRSFSDEEAPEPGKPPSMANLMANLSEDDMKQAMNAAAQFMNNGGVPGRRAPIVAEPAPTTEDGAA